MTEPAGGATALPRAFLGVGGVTLARHQLGLALAMDCQRIICVARELGPELLALQHDAEKAGARFHVVMGPRGLAGLITANDDLLVMVEGLLADPQTARALLEIGHVVLVQPVETGIAAGYERLDINYASAGAFRIPGRLVEGLQELPADCDTVSALTRIALQGGVATHEVPAAAREGAGWRLIRDETEAHAIEGEWIRLQLGERRSPTPLILLSRLGLMSVGPGLLHAGNGSRVTLLAAFTALLIGLGAGWLGYVIVGLVFTALAAVLGEGAATLRRIERMLLSRPPSTMSPEVLLGWIIDLTIVALVVWNTEAAVAADAAERAFAPLMLVIVARLVPPIFDRAFAPWFEDRVLLVLMLIVAAAMDMLMGGVEVIALSLALAAIVLPGGKPRLT
jgi:hypothetical protein